MLLATYSCLAQVISAGRQPVMEDIHIDDMEAQFPHWHIYTCEQIAYQIPPLAAKVEVFIIQSGDIKTRYKGIQRKNGNKRGFVSSTKEECGCLIDVDEAEMVFGAENHIS